jgi:hypothetical protein
VKEILYGPCTILASVATAEPVFPSGSPNYVRPYPASDRIYGRSCPDARDSPDHGASPHSGDRLSCSAILVMLFLKRAAKTSGYPERRGLACTRQHCLDTTTLPWVPLPGKWYDHTVLIVLSSERITTN